MKAISPKAKKKLLIDPSLSQKELFDIIENKEYYYKSIKEKSGEIISGISQVVIIKKK